MHRVDGRLILQEIARRVSNRPLQIKGVAHGHRTTQVTDMNRVEGTAQQGLCICHACVCS